MYVVTHISALAANYVMNWNPWKLPPFLRQDGESQFFLIYALDGVCLFGNYSNAVSRTAKTDPRSSCLSARVTRDEGVEREKWNPAAAFALNESVERMDRLLKTDDAGCVTSIF